MNNLANLLCEGLLTLPADLQLTPLDGKKCPLGYDWQHHPLTPKQLAEYLQADKGVPARREDGRIYYARNCQGFGLITGTPLVVAGVTYYLMAVDLDGDSGKLQLQELAGNEQIKPTVAFTSGRPGRCQMLYLVPVEYGDALQTRKFSTGTDSDGNPEYLELRWKNCQSVLPPSVHPITGKYNYLEFQAFSDRTPEVAPMWLLEPMLKSSQSSPETNMTSRGLAISYLDALAPERADNYESWVQVGMALHSTGFQDLLEAWDKWSQKSAKYKIGECQKKWESFHSDKDRKITIGTLAHLAKEDGWKSSPQSGNPLSRKTRKGAELNVDATVSESNNVLKKGLESWQETYELNKILANSELDERSFGQLVAALRSKLDEVLPEDKTRLEQIEQWQHYKFKESVILPHIADKLIHDADILNIEPVAIWQYLMPTILTFIGSKSNIDVESHKIPAIVWTCLVQESGTGKTRAEKLVLAPLRERQQAENERYKTEYSEYKSTLNNKKKGESSNSEEIPEPAPERKYLFEVSTIQALIKRLSEQTDNGSLWARDEIAGLFKSLNQFVNGGESEAFEILLKLWDGEPAIVDRVKVEDSFVCPATRLSVAGGIQPNVFRQIFRDPDDSQGMAARYLFACPGAREPNITHGACQLPQLLPELYRWFDQWQPGDINLEATALQRYREFGVRMQRLAQESGTTALRTWIRKLPSHLLRIVFSLHCLECYFEPERNKYIVGLDTLERGIEAAKYYLNSFHLMQEKVADLETVSSQLAKLWDKVNSTPQGLAPRDFYRNNKMLSRLAQQAGQKVNEYTLELFRQLDAASKAQLVRQGRSVRLYPMPSGGGDNPGGGNNPGGGDNPDGGDNPGGGDNADNSGGGNNPGGGDNPGCPSDDLGNKKNISEIGRQGRQTAETPESLGVELSSWVEDSRKTKKTNEDNYSALVEMIAAADGVDALKSILNAPDFTPGRFRSAARQLRNRRLYNKVVNLVAQAIHGGLPGVQNLILEDYLYIDCPEDLYSAIESIELVKPGALAIDLETTGVDPLVDKVRLLSLAADGLPPLVFNCEVLDITPLRKLICNPGIEKVAHNAKFGIEFLTKVGLTPEGMWFDTMIASKLIASAEAGTSGTHSLADVALSYLNIQMDKTSQTWKLGITEEFIAYSALKAEGLLPLRTLMIPDLTTTGLMDIATIEFEALYAVAEMELTGMRLSEQILKEIAAVKAQELAKAEVELRAAIPEVKNFGSSFQVKAALNSRGIQVASTKEKVLKPLVGKFPILAQLLVFKQAKKALEFTQKLPKHINIDGRIHASFNQYGAEATGRFSCSDPNLQQIPRGDRFRECVIPEAGHKLVIADYSQIELRLAAEISGDERMIEAYKRGEDLHKLTASLVLKKPLEEVTAADRQIAKSLNFGLLYGMGCKSLKDYAYNDHDISLSEAEARKFHADFFRTYPGLKRWHNQIARQVERGKNETRTIAGRRRLFKEPRLTAMANTPVQGSSADITKKALGMLAGRLVETRAKIIATIHDEIILECPDNTANQAAIILQETMREAGEYFLRIVPCEVEASVGSSWAAKK